MTAILDRQYPHIKLMRQVEEGLPAGTVLARPGVGPLVKYDDQIKTGPTAILLGDSEGGFAMVGFAGVYHRDAVQFAGLPLDTLGRLEARGIHFDQDLPETETETETDNSRQVNQSAKQTPTAAKKQPAAS